MPPSVVRAPSEVADVSAASSCDPAPAPRNGASGRCVISLKRRFSIWYINCRT